MSAVRAFAPGTVANLGPGLDILGLALEGAGDTVRAEHDAGGTLTIRSSGHPEISTDPKANTAGIAAAEVRRRAGAEAVGIVLEVRKGLPLSGGQGGSAASAVAAAVATNALLGSPLSRGELLETCLAAEEAVAGRHGDNVAAALFGGLVLVRSLDPPDVVPLTFPEELLLVLAEPEQRLPTAEARARLPASLPRQVALAQAAHVGALVAALARSDFDLLRRAVEDRIAEPVRAPLLPGFSEAKRAALDAGACGCSISGSGPAAFAFAAGEDVARRIADAMVSGYRSRGVAARARVRRIDGRGARLVAPGEP
jgi:homoserine kinase